MVALMVTCHQLTQANDPWTPEVIMGDSEVASVNGNFSIVVCSRKLSCAQVTQASTLVLTEFEVRDSSSPSRPCFLPCLDFSQILPL